MVTKGAGQGEKEAQNVDHEKSTQQAVTMQKEFLEACQQTSRYWVDRVQSEIVSGQV